MSRADIETTSWKSVGESGDEGLIERFGATKSIATDLLLIQVDFATNEPVGPQWIDSQQMAKHFDRSCFAGAS